MINNMPILLELAEKLLITELLYVEYKLTRRITLDVYAFLAFSF